jgi:hypothetical protein
VSTDITTRNASNLATAGEWNATLAQAEVLANTEIVPKAFQGRPHDIVAAAMIGRNVGLDPMLSMQYIHVIEGKPTMSAEAMVALVRRSGHKIEVVRLDNDGAVARGTRRDTGESVEFEFTRQNASDAGLNDKAVWKAYFRSMAWARAVSQLCRMLFADVIMGVSYVPEEVGADVDGDGTPVTIEGDVVPPRAADVPAQLQPAQVATDPTTVVAPVDVDVVAETLTPANVEPTAQPQAAASGYATLPEPEPPTEEELHLRAGTKLFPKGYPFGTCKGDAMVDVSDKDLDYYIGRADVNHPQYGEKNREQADWCRRELHRRHLAREAAAAPDFVPADQGDVSDIPFDSKGDPTDEAQAARDAAFAAQRTDGTKARVEQDAQSAMFAEAVTDVDIIDETAPADMPQPDWSLDLPDVGVFVDWTKDANALESAGMSADVCAYLVAVIVAGGVQPDTATAQASVNAVNAQRIAGGQGPLTNAIAVDQVRKIAPRIAGRLAAQRA